MKPASLFLTLGLAAVITLRSMDSHAETVIESGPDWLASTTGGSDPKPVVVVGNYGDDPWGKALVPKTQDNESLPDTTQNHVQPLPHPVGSPTNVDGGDLRVWV